MYDSKSYSGTSGCHLASAPSWFKGWVLQITSKPPFCSTVATTIMQLSLRGRELYASKRSNNSFCQLQERTSHELWKQWVSLVASEDQTIKLPSAHHSLFTWIRLWLTSSLPHTFTLTISLSPSQSWCGVSTWNAICPFPSTDATCPAEFLQQFVFSSRSFPLCPYLWNFLMHYLLSSI